MERGEGLVLRDFGMVRIGRDSFGGTNWDVALGSRLKTFGYWSRVLGFGGMGI